MLGFKSSIALPEYIQTPKAFIEKCLTDLFFLCSYVLKHKKHKEYRDLNEIHKNLCDFLDFAKTPYFQKLVLMCRDSFKSTIGRALIIQQFLKMCVQETDGLIGIVTGVQDLSEEHVELIAREILKNEYIQTYFSGYVPKSRDDADSWSKEKIRWRGIGIDAGSLKKSLTGRHYLGIWNDNFMNEINTANADIRRWAVTRWQQQESIIAEDAWELVTETPWELDDLSGVILDPDGHFDYASLKDNSPNIFQAKTGYWVFSCFARDKNGKLNFPEKLDEVYLERKKRKQGIYIYNRMYEGKVMSGDEYLFRPGWIVHRERPAPAENSIRNITVDCAGTKEKDSSYAAVSVGDWDEDGILNIEYAEKRKVWGRELFAWVCEVWDWSVKEKRTPKFMGIEKEKYGIFLEEFLIGREDIITDLLPIKNRPRHVRLMSLVAYYENGKIKSRPGLLDYEQQLREYHRGKEKDVDILDTIFWQIEMKEIPRKNQFQVPEVEVPDDFKKQVEKSLYFRNRPVREMANRLF
jgi:hypothetical protein